jgi:uncharacterized protein (TIGR02246 family)
MMSSEVALGQQTQDEVEIRAVADRLSGAWTRNDPDGFAAEFTEDAEYIGFDGAHASGRAAIATTYRRLFDGPLKDTSLTSELKEIRFLTPDVALARGASSIRLPWQATLQPRRMAQQTVVLVRRMDRWQVAALHSSKVRQIPTDGPGYTAATLAMELGREVARRAPAFSRSRRS